MVDASIATYIAAYLAGSMVLFAWTAFLDRHSLREAFCATLLWPLVLLLIPVVSMLDSIAQRGWYVDIQYRSDVSPFGFRRRPTHSIASGWAVRCLRLELQVWKHREK